MSGFRLPPVHMKGPGRARGRQLPGHKKGKMNSTEAAYEQVLRARKQTGQILNYEFEPLSLVISRPPESQAVRWTPDFMVLNADMTIDMVDVKGTRPDEQAQRAKIKTAAEKYWYFRFVVARKQRKKDGGGWKHEEI